MNDRQKWNQRYGEKLSESFHPEPHFLAQDWKNRMVGGPMLDAACGLGRGIASAGNGFDPIYAVDLSDVAIGLARKHWAGDPRIRWIVADVTQLNWPAHYFGLVCAFGYTDLEFFGKMGGMIAPGGMFMYEGFSTKQLAVRPELNPAWTTTPEVMNHLFRDWEILACGETGGPPYRVHLAAIRRKD